MPRQRWPGKKKTRLSPRAGASVGASAGAHPFVVGGPQRARQRLQQQHAARQHQAQGAGEPRLCAAQPPKRAESAGPVCGSTRVGGVGDARRGEQSREGSGEQGAWHRGRHSRRRWAGPSAGLACLASHAPALTQPAAAHKALPAPAGAGAAGAVGGGKWVIAGVPPATCHRHRGAQHSVAGGERQGAGMPKRGGGPAPAGSGAGPETRRPASPGAGAAVAAAAVAAAVSAPPVAGAAAAALPVPVHICRGRMGRGHCACGAPAAGRDGAAHSSTAARASARVGMQGHARAAGRGAGRAERHAPPSISA